MVNVDTMMDREEMERLQKANIPDAFMQIHQLSHEKAVVVDGRW